MSYIEWWIMVRQKVFLIAWSNTENKGKSIWNYLKISNFKASEGWLEKFGKWHRLVFRHLNGETANVDNVCAECKNEFCEKLKSYKLRNIFNADDTGPFFRRYPRSHFDDL